MNTKLLTPTIHRNGSSGLKLLDCLMTAVSSIQDTLDILCHTQPHGRDYYVQGDNALKEAMKEYDDRVSIIKCVLCEYQELANNVAGQIDDRTK